jgi:hypothetical protein
MKTHILRATIFVVAVISFTGCASIMSGRHADVAIDSYPSNAHVVIQDKRGREVTSFSTPGVASLKRQGRYFMPAKYTATISAPGYQPALIPIGATVNPWILGNVVIGGIPGLVVDNATGAVWKPKHSEIHQQLSPLDASPQAPMYSAAEATQHKTADPAHRLADQSVAARAMRDKRRGPVPSTTR